MAPSQSLTPGEIAVEMLAESTAENLNGNVATACDARSRAKRRKYSPPYRTTAAFALP
jgi:hypothetical protein